MHLSSYANMHNFCETYLDEFSEKKLTIFDLGSADVNGSYRSIFTNPRWKYVGVDMEAGENVDIVIQDPYHWKEIDSGCADVVISGQALEHVEYCWLFFLEIRRILRPGGMCCIIAPSAGPEHKYPVDCYRFYRDGFKALAKFAVLDGLETYTDEDAENKYEDTSYYWKDSVFIGSKPIESFVERKVIGVKHFMLKKISLM